MPPVELSLPHLVRPSQPIQGSATGKPPMLVMLHGVGSNEKEFIVLADTLDTRFLVISVRAPFVQTPMRCNWFDVERLGGNWLMNPAQVEFSRQAVIKFIREATNAYQVNPDQLYLFGFGQGAVIALILLLTAPEAATGGVAICGHIPDEMRSLIASAARLEGLPVLIQHGRLDDVYPIDQAHAARDLLVSLPVALDYREYASGHYVTQEILSDARAWLTIQLDAARRAGLPNLPAYHPVMARVQIKVRNLDRAIAFYMRFLGLRLVERVGNAFAFLSTNQMHHQIALQTVGPQAPLSPPQGTGLYHVGFEVPDQRAFALAYKTLTEAGVAVTTIDHLVSWSMCFSDPDGNGLEIFWDTRAQPGKADYWQGRDLPLRGDVVLAVLG